MPASGRTAFRNSSSLWLPCREFGSQRTSPRRHALCGGPAGTRAAEGDRADGRPSGRPTENGRAWVESRRGAGINGFVALVPLPAHQTGRARFEHPAFRLTSPRVTAATSNGDCAIAALPALRIPLCPDSAPHLVTAPCVAESGITEPAYKRDGRWPHKPSVACLGGSTPPNLATGD